MKKNKILLPLFFIVLYSVISSSCSCYKKWEYSQIVYQNGFKSNGYVCSKPNSYFIYVKYKQNLDNNSEKLLPDDIYYINSESQNLISVHFEEDIYGVNSFSFGKILADNHLKIIDTRYLSNTCGCAGGEKYFNSYFLIYNNNKLKLETNYFGKIINTSDVNKFVSESISVELSKKVNNIKSLIEFIKNINIIES